MLIDVFADLACPWCYIGSRRLARALALRPDLEVERRWRPFQLQPQMPAGGLPWDRFVREKFGGVERAAGAFGRVTEVGAADDLTFAFDRVASAPNTVDAHRLILFAGRHSRQWETADSLFAAYFAEGRDMNDHEQLVEAATRAGLSSDEVRAFLAGDECADEVAASQAEAYRLGVRGVPFYVLDGRYGLSGAQPVEVLVEVLDTVEAERQAVGAGDG